MDDGDQISAENAYVFHRLQKGFDSVGVVAVTPAECGGQNLTIQPDPETGHESHTLIKFDVRAGKRKMRRIAQYLIAHAIVRGWQHSPVLGCVTPSNQ